MKENCFKVALMQVKFLSGINLTLGYENPLCFPVLSVLHAKFLAFTADFCNNIPVLTELILFAGAIFREAVSALR